VRISLDMRVYFSAFFQLNLLSLFTFVTLYYFFHLARFGDLRWHELLASYRLRGLALNIPMLLLLCGS
jgi:hypothetical protein